MLQEHVFQCHGKDRTDYIPSFVLQKAEFTEGHGESRSAQTLSMESIQRELNALMIGKVPDNKTVMDWIEVCTYQQKQNVPVNDVNDAILMKRMQLCDV